MDFLQCSHVRSRWLSNQLHTLLWNSIFPHTSFEILKNKRCDFSVIIARLGSTVSTVKNYIFWRKNYLKNLEILRLLIILTYLPSSIRKRLVFMALFICPWQWIRQIHSPQINQEWRARTWHSPFPPFLSPDHDASV